MSKRFVKARYVGRYSQARNFKVKGGQTFVFGEIVDVDEKIIADLMKKRPDDWELIEEKAVDPKKSSSKKSD